MIAVFCVTGSVSPATVFIISGNFHACLRFRVGLELGKWRGCKIARTQLSYDGQHWGRGKYFAILHIFFFIFEVQQRKVMPGPGHSATAHIVQNDKIFTPVLLLCSLLHFRDVARPCGARLFGLFH